MAILRAQVSLSGSLFLVSTPKQAMCQDISHTLLYLLVCRCMEGFHQTVLLQSYLKTESHPSLGSQIRLWKEVGDWSPAFSQKP